MKRFNELLIVGSFLIASLVVYSLGFKENNFSTLIETELFSFQTEEEECLAPSRTIITSIGVDEVTLNWNAGNNTRWEYALKPLSSGKPVGSGLIVNTNTVSITRVTGTTTNLTPDTYYDFYIRSSCGNGEFSEWVGPIQVLTLCLSTPVPFTEGFNKNSTSLACWRTYDRTLNKPANKKTWATNSTKFEGDQSMYYTGAANNNDWLVSPLLIVSSSKIYKLSFYYRTHNSFDANFDVILMEKGGAPENVSKILLTEKGYKSASWIQKSVFFTGIQGEINLAWHVGKGSGTTTHLYLDQVELKEVSCSEPINADAKDILEDTVTLYWEDDIASSWEYYVQKEGGNTPTGTGKVVTEQKAEVKAEDNGTPLVPNTAYEFYLRSNCAALGKAAWVGPFQFRTACKELDLPFYEDFDTSSQTQYCWVVLDENNDATDKEGLWKLDKSSYIGSHAMYYYIYDFLNEKEADDYLISPTFNLDSTKTYRLQYYYKSVSRYQSNEFEVVASNKGIAAADFQKVIVPIQSYSNDTYVLKTAFVSNLGGTVNLAWHATNKGSKGIYIDAVRVEEVEGCPEPLDLDVANIQTNKITLSWSDDYGGTSWEYLIQEGTGTGPIGTGTKTMVKSNTITQDSKGQNLKPNTAYEYYVRTVCAGGDYSIWSGPYLFVTACEVNRAPFFEGFNSNVFTSRCWSIIDANQDINMATGNNIWKLDDKEPFEGDLDMYFFGNGKPNDDWLISPEIEVETGTYVLKYFYKSHKSYDANFQVLLSNNGAQLDEFKTVLVGQKSYNNKSYKEEVVFFNTTKGVINIAWYINQTGYVGVYLDNIHLKKIEDCEEPFDIQVVNQTNTSIDITWTQNGAITAWEIEAVELGKMPGHTSAIKQAVNITAAATINGLTPGKAYTIYVRAICDATAKTFSEWSTGKDSGTRTNGANDDCAHSIALTVNDTSECKVSRAVSLNNATVSTIPTPTCQPKLKHDIWFEFVAKNKNHLFTVSDLIGESGLNETIIYAALYDQACTAITATAIDCMTFTRNDTKWILRDLTPGKKYTVRLGSETDVDPVFFSICITSASTGSLIVSPSGDVYTKEQLITDVLVNSSCDLVSNINYQVGDGSPATQTVNTLGYFEKGDSFFPFEKGIVLSTGEVKYVPGPYLGDQLFNRGNNPNRWVGDKDINDAIADAGGGPRDDKRITQIEFDFIPINDSLNFEYLFASNSYIKGCDYSCDVGALFAAWLVDTATGEGQNLAKIPRTNTPIALNTIRDAQRSGIKCGSNNSEYYWKHYTNNVDEPIDSPIDFVGFTKEMSSKTIQVVPFRKYHIKLAVIDFCTNNSHTSAVFFNAGSFNLGGIDLGKDLLVESSNALCNGQDTTIDSGVDITHATLTWYKDDQEIVGEKNSKITVTDGGDYKVVAHYDAINCEIVGEIRIEQYPLISELIKEPHAINFCRYNVGEIELDLTQVERAMFGGTDRADFEVMYSEEDTFEKSIEQPSKYTLKQHDTKKIYIQVENKNTGCEEVFVFNLIPTQGEMPNSIGDVIQCDVYVLPSLQPNQFYYTEAAGKGKHYKAGDQLTAGEHKLYVFQDNGQGCFEETSFTVKVTEKNVATLFSDITLECELYELKPLPEGQKYVISVEGILVELAAGTIIQENETKITIIAESSDGICIDESSFTVYYNECPIPKGFSPNGDGINDRFDLSNHGVSDLKIFNRNGVEVYSFKGAYTNQWEGQSKGGGKTLPSGTYYYVITAFGKTRTGWVQLNR